MTTTKVPFDLLDCTSLSADLGDTDPDVARRQELLGKPRMPSRLHDHRLGALTFQADEALRTAINTALAVEMPLLITGEPGTGKTQVAWFIAAAFGLGEPIALHVKSTTTSQHLLYDFDAVKYFRDAGDPERRKLAIDRGHYLTPGPLWRALAERTPRLILIDEIDKAPRDFPNDLLHVLDQYWFEVPELDGCHPDGERLPSLSQQDGRFRVERDPELRAPIVVITSNSERRLPEPFLRRCVFHHIELNPELVQRAVKAWREREITGLEDEVVERALEAFHKLRQRDLRKPPSTAELLAWLKLLSQSPQHRTALSKGLPPLKELPLLAALLKDREDYATIARP